MYVLFFMFQKVVKARLMLDAMGNGSPISKQIRGPVEPDGVCVVVGSCASGYNEQNNTYSDVIYTGTYHMENYFYQE